MLGVSGSLLHLENLEISQSPRKKSYNFVIFYKNPEKWCKNRGKRTTNLQTVTTSAAMVVDALCELIFTTSLPNTSHISSYSVAGPRFPRRGGGAPTPEGAQTLYLTNFSQKLHENEKKLAQRGGWRPCTPARSANGIHLLNCWNCIALDTFITARIPRMTGGYIFTLCVSSHQGGYLPPG